jgi:hypothetical protein
MNKVIYSFDNVASLMSNAFEYSEAVIVWKILNHIELEYCETPTQERMQFFRKIAKMIERGLVFQRLDGL